MQHSVYFPLIDILLYNYVNSYKRIVGGLWYVDSTARMFGLTPCMMSYSFWHCLLHTLLPSEWADQSNPVLSIIMACCITTMATRAGQ